jgi:uncharacterized Zn-finger protein
VAPGLARGYGAADRFAKELAMAEHGVPHFHNEPGVAAIHVGSKEFMCIGALPPFDHPHVFLDMGSDSEIVCPYCSTLYRHDASLKAGASQPTGCVWEGDAAEAA